MTLLFSSPSWEKKAAQFFFLFVLSPPFYRIRRGSRENFTFPLSFLIQRKLSLVGLSPSKEVHSSSFPFPEKGDHRSDKNLNFFFLPQEKITKDRQILPPPLKEKPKRIGVLSFFFLFKTSCCTSSSTELTHPPSF